MNASVNIATPLGAVSFAAAVVAVVVSLLLPGIYRSEALLAPSKPENSNGIAALASQYAGLARLAGIDLDAGKIDKTAFGLEILRSRRFITEFIERHDALVPLIAAYGWDRSTRELKADADDYDLDTGDWVRTVRRPKSTIPSNQEAYEEFVELDAIPQGDNAANLTLRQHDYLKIDRLPDWISRWTVTLEGEVRFPDEYRVRPGETMDEVFEQAGGVTEDALVEIAIFLRESLKEREREQIEMLASQCEADVVTLPLQSVDSGSSVTLGAGRVLFDRMRPLTFWGDVAQIVYQGAIAIAAVKIF